MAGMGTTDSPTPADDLAELRAYAEKGPAVSRATCGRIADRLQAAGPDLRTAAQALLVRIADHDANLPPRRHVGDWPTVEALRAALAAEATEPTRGQGGCPTCGNATGEPDSGAVTGALCPDT